MLTLRHVRTEATAPLLKYYANAIALLFENTPAQSQ
jgi:hypothetical protein